MSIVRAYLQQLLGGYLIRTRFITLHLCSLHFGRLARPKTQLFKCVGLCSRPGAVEVSTRRQRREAES